MTILTTDTKKLYDIELRHHGENGSYYGRKNYIDDFYDEAAPDAETDGMGSFLMTSDEFSAFCAEWKTECALANSGKDGESLEALNKWQIADGEYWAFYAYCIKENAKPEYLDDDD